MGREKNFGNYLYDRIIVVSENVTLALLEKCNIRIPDSRTDLKKYRITREIYAGRVMMPVLDEKK